MFPSPRCPRAGQSGLWQNWACGSNGDPPGARFGTMLGGMLGGPALFKPQPPSPRFLGVLPNIISARPQDFLGEGDVVRAHAPASGGRSGFSSLDLPPVQ